jgi:hypothetical protein
MARIAIIDSKSKLVENLIVANADYVPPDDKLAVESDTAAIGNTWDGKSFTASPVNSRSTLREHAKLRSTDTYKIAITIPAVGSMPAVADQLVTPSDQRAIAYLADRAKADSSFSAPWQPNEHGEPAVMLNAKQWIAFNNAIGEWCLAHLKAYAGVVQAINDGKIADWESVDHPPESFPQWPKRYIDTPRQIKRMADAHALLAKQTNKP